MRSVHFSAVLVALMLGSVAHAGSPDALQPTDLCRDVRRAVRAGDKKRRVKRIIKHAEQVDAADVRCLRSSRRVPEYATRVAQRQMLDRGGLDALPAAPVEVIAVIPDPIEIVRIKGSEIEVLAAQAASVFGLSGPVERQVRAEMERGASEALRSHDVQGEVSTLWVEARGWTGSSYHGKERASEPIPDDRLLALRIVVTDAVEVARRRRGDLLVGLGMRLGRDIEAEVESIVQRMMWEYLWEEEIPSLVVTSRGTE